MKTTSRLAFATVSVLALAAAPALAQDVRLGFVGGFTGPIESLTPPIFAAAELAVAHVNAQGGILTGGTLSITAADGACDATQAANAADRLVNTEQVTAIVGGLCSGETISGANNAGIPGNVVFVSPASTAPTLTTLDDNDLVFRTAPSDAYQGEVLARLVLARGVSEIAVTYVNNDYGRGLADAFAGAYVAGGGRIAATASHEEGRADYRPELGTLAASGAETLLILAYASGSGQTVLRQAVESGNFTRYFGADGTVGSDLFTGVPLAAVEGFIATRPAAPEVPGSAIFNELAAAAGIDPTSVFAPQAYDAAFLLALAIEANRSAGRTGVSAALRAVASAPGEIILPGEWEKAKALLAQGIDINYEGASGSHEFDEAGDVPGAILETIVRNGMFVDVGPAL